MNVNEIVKTLKNASDAYYNSGDALMSDAAFDALVEELRKLDPTNNWFKTIGAPPQIGVWPKRKHATFMGSQFKVTTEEEFNKWAAKLQSDRVALSLKLDGSTIVLTYEKGKLKFATLRGSGDEGEVITPNAIKMENVKEVLPISFTGDLRGEILLSTDNFSKYFAPLGYKNARNSATGSARDKNGKMVSYLRVIYFDIIGSSAKTEEEKQKFVENLNLQYVHTKYMNCNEVWTYFAKFDRKTVPFLIDGMVCKLDNLAQQDDLGIVDGRPKGMMAMKWPSQGGISKVNDITWQVGMSGRISPVAELEPVEIDGVTIRRCTLNNLDFIKEKDVAIGDIVEILRFNDCIPGLSKVIDRSNRQYVCKICSRKDT